MLILKTLKPLEYILISAFIGGSLLPLALYMKFVNNPSYKFKHNKFL